MIFVFLALALGGMVKGATGAGAPVVAIPVLAAAYDVRFAVTLMVVPNLMTNLVQIWRYRADRLPDRFTLAFALAGGVGVGLGSLALVALSPDVLAITVAVAVVIYILVRFLHPGWALAFPIARRLAAPAGLTAGILQGATGISAPVAITFLNAMRLARPQFIVTISVFFAVMAAIQVPVLAKLGLMTGEMFLYGLLALVPLAGAMPLGNALARFMSARTFDRIVLLLLAATAAKLVIDVLL